MTMRVARPGAPSHLRVAGDPATIVTTALVGAVERLMLHDAEMFVRNGLNFDVSLETAPWNSEYCTLPEKPGSRSELKSSPRFSVVKPWPVLRLRSKS